jgi:RNA polymerase sigma-70 factor (ECF subfamily)
MRETGDPVERRFSELMEAFGHVLRRALARAAPPDCGVDPDDLEQEARIRIWRALASEKEIREPASFFYRVAITATLDAYRRATSRRHQHPASRSEREPDAVSSAEIHTSEGGPELRIDRSRLLRAVHGALGSLAENRRRAVALHLQGFSTTEIGELLAWTEPKARNLVYRGLADLRGRLEAEGIRYEGG